MGLEFSTSKVHPEHHPPSSERDTHPYLSVPGGNERGSTGWLAQGLTGLGKTAVEEQFLFSQQGQGGYHAPTGQLQGAKQQ